jgi:branched-chain amino acid transport system permease protein
MAIMPRSIQLSSQLATVAENNLQSRPQLAPGTTVLRVEGITKNFGGLRALDGVGFSVSAAEVVALVGPNGAGKSTLFDIISGLVPLSSGAVSLMNERIEGLKPRAIAERGLARTFQHTDLRGEMTVLENVALGAHFRGTAGMLRAALRLDRAEEARILTTACANLERLGLREAAAAPAASLPLGRQRTVEVARALTADPIIMLLDEPAAGLRYLEKRELAGAIEDMRGRGIAVLLVEHDLEFVAQVADRVIVLDFGTMIAQGTPAEVVRDKRVVEAYLGTTDDEHERAALCT